MSDELNGTNAVLFKFNGTNKEIIGQLEMTRTALGALIEVQSKTDNDFVTLLDGELSSAGTSVSGTIIYNSDAEYRQVRADAQAGNVGAYALDIDGVLANLIEFNAIPNGLSDALTVGDKVTTTITLLSTGE